VPGDVPLGLRWLGWRQRVADGTIAAQVVTHRRFLLLWV
jgi:hypothetical protein